MSRLSPITLSLAALVVAVLSGTVFLIVHSHQLRRDPSSEQDPAPPVEAPARAPEIASPTPPPAAPPPPVVPAVVVADSPAELDAQPANDDPQPPAPSRRGLLAINHNRRMVEADENVFASMGMPDSSRASIRQINEDFRRRTEPSSDASTATPTAMSDAAAALKARQDALTLLLGTDSAKVFDAEERTAVMRLRGKYRFEWGRQLRQ